MLGCSVAAVTLLNRSGFNIEWYGNMTALGSYNEGLEISDAILRKINSQLVLYDLSLRRFVLN